MDQFFTHRSANNQGSFGKASYTPSMDYSSGFEEDADESPYESDFEDFDDQDTINQKCKLLSNIEGEYLDRLPSLTLWNCWDTAAVTEAPMGIGL